MQVSYFKALWGMDMPVKDAVPLVLAAGFDGIEAPLGQIQEARAAGYTGPAIAMLFGEDAKKLAADLPACAAVRSTKVTVHAGTEYWDFEKGSAFLKEFLPAVADSGLEVNIETHRGRLLFDPTSTVKFLEAFPTLHVCADVSHWTCVCGNMLESYDEALKLVASRTRHIHARVGHTEGPQVPDPRAAQWKWAVDRFVTIWSGMKEAAEKRGDTVLTVDPEFGPPNYLWTNVSDGKPVADLFEVCVWMRDELKRRWA
jgi:hypothetical protein